MEKTRTLTFKQQVKVCIAVFIIDIVLAHLFQTGLFHNLSWLVYGAMFLVNPVLPERWWSARMHPKAAVTGLRIAGAICIYIGLTGRFGI